MTSHDPISAESTAPFILSLDTAGPACQAVVSAAGVVVSARSSAMVRGHGEALVPMVEEALAGAGIGYEDLGQIGVTIGPGSFTGMRVGLAAARGFSATLNVPVVGIGSLEALALTDRLESNIEAIRAVAIDARNGLVYGQRFEADGTAMELPNVMADIVFAASVPNGARVLGPAKPVIAALARSAGKRITLGSTAAVPAHDAMAQLAALGNPAEKPKPLYLKPADAVAAKPAGLRSASM